MNLSEISVIVTTYNVEAHIARCLANLQPFNEIIVVDFNPANSSAGSMDAKGNVHVWETDSGKELFRIESQSNEFSKNVSAAGGGLRRELLTFPAVSSEGGSHPPRS